MRISPDEYMSTRVDEQISYYDKQSIRSQLALKRLTAIQIFAGALIPIISGFSTAIVFSEWILAFLGFAITCSTAFLALNKYQERSINFRMNCETLKHYKHLFLAGVSPYNGEDAFDLFVNEVESLMTKEHSNWASYSRKEQSK